MMTVQCCKCKRVRQGSSWVVCETLPEGPVSHTYCSKCYLESCLEFFSAEASRSCHTAAHAVSHLIQGI